MVDFKKLMNRTEEEKEKADKEFLESVKNEPSVIRMKKLLGER